MEQLPEEEYKLAAPLFVDADDFPVSRWLRLANYLIDVFMILILSGITGAVIGVAIVLLHMSYLTQDTGFNILNRIIGTLVAFSYYAAFELVFQRSIGKMVTGTIVVDMDGNKPTWQAILRRSASRLVPFEAFSFLGGVAGWHDKWSDTRVMKVKDIPNLQIKKHINEMTT
jgi:uncharacterized RDD family membrane protein YckC